MPETAGTCAAAPGPLSRSALCRVVGSCSSEPCNSWPRYSSGVLCAHAPCGRLVRPRSVRFNEGDFCRLSGTTGRNLATAAEMLGGGMRVRVELLVEDAARGEHRGPERHEARNERVL